jgi:hypothetical protein
MPKRGYKSERCVEREMASMVVDQLLSGLKQGGLLDSKGEFSLDFGRAMQQLGLQTLPDPRMYVLRLVQSAVAGGATQIRVQSSTRGLQFYSAGVDISVEHLRNLGSYLLADRGSPTTRYLAQGLHSALALDPLQIRLFTWNGSSGVNLRLQGNESDLQELHESPFVSREDLGTCVVVMHRPTWFFRRAPELEWLRKRCGVGPVDLLVDGRVLAPAFGQPREVVGLLPQHLPFHWVTAPSVRYAGRTVRCARGHHIFRAQCLAEAGEPHRFSLPRTHASWIYPARRLKEGRWQIGVSEFAFVNTAHKQVGLLSMALAIRADLPAEGTARFVKDGVMLDPVALKKTGLGVEALAGAGDLKTDLTGFKMVDDDALQARGRELAAAAKATWKLLMHMSQASSYRGAVDYLLNETGT